MRVRFLIFFVAGLMTLHAELPGQTKKTSQKSGQKSPSKPAAEPVYLTGAFDSAVRKLPPHFNGNSFSQLYRGSAGVAPKGEFETTAEYAARTAKTSGGLIALVVDPSMAQYDADSETMTVSLVPLTITVGYDNTEGYVVNSKITDQHQYVGSNAFGATANITSTSSDIQAVVPKSGALSGGVDFAIKMPRDEAQRLKPTLKILLIGSLANEQPKPLGDGGYNGYDSTKATLAEPHEESRTYFNLAVDLVDAWVFDSATGDVKARYSERADAGRMQVTVYESPSEADGYAVVSVRGNNDLTLQRGFTRFGGGCSIRLGNTTDLTGLKQGKWIGAVDIDGRQHIVVTDAGGNVLFDEKVATTYGSGTALIDEWSESRRAAEAMWKAAPGGTVELKNATSASKSKASLAGFRELWSWGMENCSFPSLE